LVLLSHTSSRLGSDRNAPSSMNVSGLPENVLLGGKEYNKVLYINAIK
jgi:hypothetical protein